jgi:hypothetical protein
MDSPELSVDGRVVMGVDGEVDGITLSFLVGTADGE